MSNKIMVAPEVFKSVQEHIRKLEETVDIMQENLCQRNWLLLTTIKLALVKLNELDVIDKNSKEYEILQELLINIDINKLKEYAKNVDIDLCKIFINNCV